MAAKLANDSHITLNQSVSIQGNNCEDEPIRIPGSIQRHGFLLVLDDRGEQIVAASQNAEEFLEIPLALILGTSVETILEREILGSLRALSFSTDDGGLLTYLGAFQLRGRFFSVLAHRVEHERILEFEVTDRFVNPEMTTRIFTNFVSRLNSLRSEQDLCQALAEQIKNLTGFHRVLLYSFDEAGHGTVLCEQNDGILPSYFDLRFPASDIPQQARDLYVLNTVRIIPNAVYVPSPLQALDKRPSTALDLSTSVLRSVSPVHLEYMQNMGTIASMSVSIVCDGKLWGLVSAHHAEPRTVPYLLRSACDLLGRLVATQLTGIATSAKLRKMVQFHAVQRRMLTYLAGENNYFIAMADHMKDLMQVTDADGAALVEGGQCKVAGITPNDDDLRRLAEWMDSRPDLEFFETHHLSSHFDWAAKFTEVASGMMVIRISRIRNSYFMWFRPELVSTVRWAGQPEKVKNSDLRLNPRKSFEAWSELVHGESKPWTEVEVESATEFRSAVIAISLKRAEEAVQLGEARFLQLTNALPHPVWTADDDGQLTYVNQKWLDQGFGNSGCWYEQENLVKEDELRSSILWKAAVVAGTAFDLEVKFQSRSEATERSNLVRVVPYFRANGARAGWAGTCTDLTDRRQREAALRMTEKLALTGRMTSVIAHEINNPLEAIGNLLYLLSGSLTQDETARGYIAMAESELKRISGITKQTLRWSKESVQKAQYGVVGDLFTDVLQLFAGQIRNRQVSITVDGGSEVNVYGTIGQIAQVMANLMSNAIHAVSVGGQIWLNAREVSETVEITVRDNGHGMNDEALRNLFEPFYSTKGDLGNGLGLYISHEIVERHGGTLTVESSVGAGTQVRMRFPLHDRA